MNQFSRLITMGFVSSCVLLQGCQSVKKSLGMEREAPDEFAVNPSTQSLDMPPDFFVLPVPTPGAPRPQEKKALQVSKEKLLGPESKGKQSSSGQAALLKMAGAKPGQDKVRYQVDNETKANTQKTDKTILEHLGVKKTKPKGDVINPREEVKELQKKDIPQAQVVDE